MTTVIVLAPDPIAHLGCGIGAFPGLPASDLLSRLFSKAIANTLKAVLSVSLLLQKDKYK